MRLISFMLIDGWHLLRLFGDNADGNHSMLFFFEWNWPLPISSFKHWYLFTVTFFFYNTISFCQLYQYGVNFQFHCWPDKQNIWNQQDSSQNLCVWLTYYIKGIFESNFFCCTVHAFNASIWFQPNCFIFRSESLQAQTTKKKRNIEYDLICFAIDDAQLTRITHSMLSHI